MLIIEHRKNTIEELRNVPKYNGVEIDIRSYRNRLVLHHEPFYEGTDFEEWLQYYDHAFVILNVKEEGIEKKVQALIDDKGVKDYFYLDLSFPYLIKMMNSKQKNIAVRFSEYESIETCISLAGRLNWVWVDGFTRFPLDDKSYQKLSKYFKICLVSPELVGRVDEIKDMQMKSIDMKIDAVCTKYPERWSSF